MLKIGRGSKGVEQKWSLIESGRRSKMADDGKWPMLTVYHEIKIPVGVSFPRLDLTLVQVFVLLQLHLRLLYSSRFHVLPEVFPRHLPKKG